VHGQIVKFGSGSLTMNLAVLLTPSTDYTPWTANLRSGGLAMGVLTSWSFTGHATALSSIFSDLTGVPQGG
jgi:hypothetical protein